MRTSGEPPYGTDCKSSAARSRRRAIVGFAAAAVACAGPAPRAATGEGEDPSLPGAPSAGAEPSGVASAGGSATPPGPRPEEGAPPPGGDGRVVVAFDCESTGEHKRGQSLRRWEGGGPSGAAWNVDPWPLRCTSRLRAPCDGRALLQLFGNARAFASEARDVREGAALWKVDVPAATWDAALMRDQALVYETLAFTLSGVVVCKDGGENHPFADAFLAGFSGGE